MDRNMMMDQVMKTAGECDIVVSGLKTGGITCHLLRQGMLEDNGFGG